jgi:hypothetical protein
MWPAPLFLELPAALADALGLTVDPAAPDVLEACCVVAPAPLVAAGVEAAPEGVTVPLIWAWTEALKVPDMPVRLFEPLRESWNQEEDATHANLAENASAGKLVWVASFRLLDVNLMKLTDNRDWPSFRDESNTTLTSCRS